ncbi:hypothetical protein ANTPLA_LOCUS9826 [Anthophora plagiata]
MREYSQRCILSNFVKRKTDFLKVTSILFLLVCVCNASSYLRNDRDGSSSNNDQNFVRHTRRIALNEYLVPPPLPRPHSIRSGRVANPSSKETPGYFSQLMNWLNPFNFGSPTSQKSHLEAPYASHPQSYGPPSFNLHSAPQQSDSSFHSLGSQPTLPFYPPLGPPPAQHSGSHLTTPFSTHPGLPLSPPPNPSVQIYNVPSGPLHNVQNVPSPVRTNDGTYVLVNKGKACNPCNKIPWIPMQDGGPNHSEKHSQLSDGYLPPSNQPSHDIQYAASDEIKIPVFSEIPVEQSRQQPFTGSLANPFLYSGLMPFYKPEPLESQSTSFAESFKQFEQPSRFITPPSYKEETSPQVIVNQNYNAYVNEDLTSSGTQVNQGHVSNEVEIKKEHTEHNESFDGSIFDNEHFGQKYQNNPTVPRQESIRVLGDFVQEKENTVVSYESSNPQNHNLNSQNGNGYYDTFKSNSNYNVGSNRFLSDSSPSASYGTSNFNNHQIGNSNYQYSDDQSPSGSVNKDSQVTTQISLGSTIQNGLIHFEESPLLDLTKKSESPTDTQWSTSTISYTDVNEVSESTVKTTTDYTIGTDSIFVEDTSSFIKPTESYSTSDIQNINKVFGMSTFPVANLLENNRNQYTETSTVSAQYTNQDVLHVSSSGQQGFSWTSLLANASNMRNDSLKNHLPSNHLAQWNDLSSEVRDPRKQDNQYSKNTKDIVQKQSGIKRNKQVQVIIPYTSEYTPVPFQHTYGDWSIKTNFERSQSRKASSPSELNIDNYIEQESRNDIRVVNQSQHNFNNSNHLNVQPTESSSITVEESRNTATKMNNTIDVRRLQKNIDNWTIQEYSKPTTSSTILPSSLHPYLLPSKKIPTEYLTTTESGNYANDSKDRRETVKTYSLAGFSFNEVEHEGSSSYHVEKIQEPDTAIQIDSSKTTASGSVTQEKSTWETYSVTISPVNKERVYVVTPQPIPETSSKHDYENREREWERENSQHKSESIVNDENNNKSNLSEFEAIEKAYQVLPQAVNNLAVASTGKENIPLWGIMEHEQFASLNLDEIDETTADDILDRPVLYSGHSKVSRAKR